jgi:hypothetical protein
MRPFPSQSDLFWAEIGPSIVKSKIHGTKINGAMARSALVGLLLASCCLATGCRPDDERSQEPGDAVGQMGDQQFDLQDRTESAGITFEHTHGGAGKMYIMEAMTGGMATIDFDHDGLVDLYFLSGAPLQGTEKTSPPPRNALYRNLGNWRFQDVTQAAGVADSGFGLGVTAADFDNDGWCDLYVNNYGPNVLYRNNGDGTFDAVTVQVGIDAGDAVGAGTCFLDLEGDGDLDLYSGNYVQFSYERHPERILGGVMRAPSPLDFDAAPDKMFRNNGDDTFTDVSDQSGVGVHAGRTMGMVSGDFDGDGDTDFFACNDVMENFYWQNDGTGKFEEAAMLAGVAYDFWGRANGSMGAACSDFDNDGWLDLFMTDYQGELPVLYHNLGQGSFEDIALESGVTQACHPHVNWGCIFVDLDCDGDRDLYVGHGHLEPMIRLVDATTDYELPNTLFENLGDRKFADVTAQAGAGMSVVAATRGVCAEDFDNDGDPDLVMLNQEARPTLLENAARTGHHWLQIRLVGTTSSRSAIGSQVKVVTGDTMQLDELRSGHGYQSSGATRLYFGLGDHSRVDRIEVHWLGGDVQTLEDVPADQLLTIVEP